jgi:hypothetical protein
MRSSETRRIAKRAADTSLDDRCLCATCRRPMVNEVKHCVLDPDWGSLILCDSCYVGDERRYDWEHRGNPLPQRWALSRATGR